VFCQWSYPTMLP